MNIQFLKEEKEKPVIPSSSIYFNWPHSYRPTPHSHQPLHSSHWLQRQLQEKGAWGLSAPAGRWTLCLGEGGRGVLLHCRRQSSQKKNSSVFQELIAIRAAGEDQRVWGSNREECVSAAQIFPRLVRWFQVFECLSGFEEQGQLSRCQLDSMDPFYHDKAAVFHPPRELAVCDFVHFYQLKQCFFFLYIKECSWIELHKVSQITKKFLKIVCYIPQPPFAPHCCSVYFLCLSQGLEALPGSQADAFFPLFCLWFTRWLLRESHLANYSWFIIRRLSLLLLPLSFKMIIDL